MPLAIERLIRFVRMETYGCNRHLSGDQGYEVNTTYMRTLRQPDHRQYRKDLGLFLNEDGIKKATGL